MLPAHRPALLRAAQRTRTRRTTRPGTAAVAIGLAAATGLATAQTAVPEPAATPAAREPAVEPTATTTATTTVTTTNTLPPVRAKARAIREGRAGVQAVTSRIGKGEQELRDIPQSVTVVTERLIDDRNLDTLKDALHNTAGVSFLAAEGGEEDIRLRGFSLQATGDVFVDGMRDPAFYERDSFNWDRLEVLRGSASMLFGRGSTGGAVNQASKQPNLFGRNEVSVTLGSGHYLRGTADLTTRLGENAALRINGMLTQASDNGVGARLDKQGLAVAAGFGIGTRHEFQASLYHLRHDDGVNYGLPYLTPGTGAASRVLVPVKPNAFYGMASDQSAGGVDMATLQHIWRIRPGTELRTSVRAAQYDRDLRASAIRFAAAAAQPDGTAVTGETFGPDTVLTRGTNLKVQGMETLYAQSDFSTRFRALGMGHSVQAGVDLAKEDFTNYALGLPAGVTLSKPTTRIGTPDDGAWVDESSRVRSVNRTFDAQALGVYAQNLIQLAPTWKLLLGLRWDRFDGTYDTPAIVNASTGAVTAATQRARSDSLWSKRFGVLWQPDAFQSWHFSYGTSFNTSGDTYQYDALGSNTPPEGSVNYELGGKLDFFNGNLTVRTALFHAVKTNERNRDAESVTPTTYVLSGRRHASGFEIDLAGRIHPAWEVFVSYAFIPDAQIDRGVPAAGGTVAQSLQGEPVGSRPGLIPRHSGTVWTTWQLSPNWRVGGGLNARSAMNPYQVTTFTVPGYVTADLMAEYTLQDLSFKLNLSNLTNRLYADMVYRGHYIPGKGRQVQLTGTYRF